jgi:hypothetical protein
MEPSDQYVKSKRNLVLFSGLLALSATIGLDFSSKGSGSLLPVSLRDINLLDEIFVILVLYFIFQASLFWSAQATAVRTLPQYKWDFFATIAISVFALLTYVIPIVQSIAVISFRYAERFVETLPRDLLPLHLIDLVSSTISVVSVLLAVLRFTRGRVERSRIDRGTHELMILQTLTNSTWKLIFNPNSPKGSKKITFDDDGPIGEGQNDNESTWRLRDGLLEILNKEGQVFSRFRYDVGERAFLHTNDDDTLSIRRNVSNRGRQRKITELLPSCVNSFALARCRGASR